MGPCRVLRPDDWIGCEVAVLWWIGLSGCMWGLGIVGGAVKEGEGGNVAIHREDFSEEVGGVDEVGDEYKVEKLLAHPLLQPVETHVDRLRKGRGLLGVAKVGEGERELSQHLPAPKGHGILRLCHRRTTTGMRWQKAWRGALWVVGEGSG